MALHLYEGHLHPVPPFEFEYCRRFVQEQALADIDASQPHTLAFVMPWGAVGVLVTLRSLGKVESPLVLAQIQSPLPLTESEQNQIHNTSRFRFGMDEDIQPLYTLGWDDDPFADILDEWYGYHQVKFASPFAAACWGWLREQGGLAAGAKMWANLLTLGPGQAYETNQLHAFPNAAQLVAAGPEQLGSLLFDAALGSGLWELARAFPGSAIAGEPAGPPSPHTLSAIQSWLTEECRLTPAARHQLLSGGLGLMDTLELPPEQILAIAQQIYGADLQLEALQKMMARYESWQGYWYHYLGLPKH